METGVSLKYFAIGCRYDAAFLILQCVYGKLLFVLEENNIVNNHAFKQWIIVSL